MCISYLFFIVMMEKGVSNENCDENNNVFGCAPPPNSGDGRGDEDLFVIRKKSPIKIVDVSDSDEELDPSESRGASPTLLNEHVQLRNNFLLERKKFVEEREEDRQKLLVELGKLAFDTIEHIENAGAKSQIKIDELQARLAPLQENYDKEKKKLDFYYTLQNPTRHHLKAAAIQSAVMTKAGANLQLEHRKVDREITAELQRASSETTRLWALQRAPVQQLCKDFADKWSLRGQSELVPLAQKMNRAKHKNHEECLAAGASKKRTRCDSSKDHSTDLLPAGASNADSPDKNIDAQESI